LFFSCAYYGGLFYGYSSYFGTTARAAP